LRRFFPWDRLPACPLLRDIGSELLLVAVLFLFNPDRLEACPLLRDIGSELLLVAVLFLFNPDRLEAYPLLQDIGSELLLVAVLFLFNPDRLEAYPLLQDIGSELLLVAVHSLLNPDRLEAYPTCLSIQREEAQADGKIWILPGTKNRSFLGSVFTRRNRFGQNAPDSLWKEPAKRAALPSDSANPPSSENHRTQGVQNVLFRINKLSNVRLAGFALATLVASPTGFAQEPQPKMTPVAVVDMEHVLDNHPTFTAQMEAMKAEFQMTMKDFEDRRKKISESIQQLQSQLNSDSPEFKQREEAIVSQESKLRLDAKNKQEEFDERQARLMLDTYNQIVSGVTLAARYYKFDLVVRYNRKQTTQMNPKKPQSVLYGADREVIYFNPENDLTEPVIGILKRDIPAAATAVNPAAPATNNPGGKTPLLANPPGGPIRK
jgi:outer membrane protein